MELAWTHKESHNCTNQLVWNREFLSVWNIRSTTIINRYDFTKLHSGPRLHSHAQIIFVGLLKYYISYILLITLNHDLDSGRLTNATDDLGSGLGYQNQRTWDIHQTPSRYEITVIYPQSVKFVHMLKIWVSLTLLHLITI